MEKTDKVIPAYDTGIYRDPPQRYVDITDPVVVRASWEKEDQEIFNLDTWLTKAQKFAQETIDCYEYRPKSPPPNWGFPRSPSKSEGIHENVKRQLEYARTLRVYVQHVHQALDKGDSREAALYGFLVGQYYEALRVCQVEHVAVRGRKNIAATRKGHAGRYGTMANKQRRWDEYQQALVSLATNHPTWKLTALRSKVAKNFSVSFKTIERHTIDPRILHK